MQGENTKQMVYQNSYICNFTINREIKNIKCPIINASRIMVSNLVSKIGMEPPHITAEMKQVYINTTKLPGHRCHF